MFSNYCITRLNELEVDFLKESFKRCDSVTKLLTCFHDLMIMLVSSARLLDGWTS